MAHALRYYKELTQPDGTVIRLEIHKKKLGDAIAVASEIGRVVQALHLDIQGGADTIDAPIVKTSLTMTFVDAPDLEEGKKCGNWEEFYTPDSTMWMVVLKADGKTIWGGYVTPDSYQEDLRYRGSVTIIARDNIGHMQDFPFDMEGNADGMVTLQELVNEAWAKIESPMSLDWRHEGDDADYLLCDGVEAPQTYLNVSAFEDMNYFDAVEKALYSYGLVMRYTGSNRVAIMSLRDVPYQGKSSAPRAVEPIFLAHAQRELAPAVRRIEEAVKYEFTDGIQIPLAKNVTFSGVAYTVPFYSTNVFGETTTKSIPVHAIANTDGEGWSNVPSSTLFFNPKKYTIRQTALAEDAERMLFLACNTDGSHSAIYRKTVVCADFRINMTFGRPVERDSYGGVGYCYGFSDSDDREQSGIGSLSARSVDCYISREQNGIQQFFDGHTWSADAVLLTIEVTDRQCGIDVPLGESSGTAEVTLTIVDVRLNDKWDFSDGLGLYIPISSMYWGVAETASLCETNNVNTVYVHTNNVILEHSPELAPALDEVPFPSVIKNGIFVKSGNAYLPAKGWAWSGGTPQQMAVYNHLQLLCYHSKPNNIISGDIVNADFVDMEAIYEWGGANHLLVSGSYNFLNGRIESAVLREFKFYSEMWSDVAGAEVPETEQNNRTTAESGSGASKASTYSNVTTVTIGGTGGGGTGGSSTLAGLLDVQVSSPSNGQALVYDSASGMWMNKTIEKGNDITSQSIISALGYTPFDSDAFTKSNIKNALGIADWALASTKPSYTWTEIRSRPTALSAFTNDLGLGSLAYKSSLVASDIPSLPWSKITSGKPTTLSGYGITDAVPTWDGVFHSSQMNAIDSYRQVGYGNITNGWKTNGPAIAFGISGYTLRIQAEMALTDNPAIYASLQHNSTAYGWVRLLTDANAYTKADAVGYNANIDLASDYKAIGYGYADKGWKGAGPAMVFGTSGYNMRMQMTVRNSDYPKLYIAQSYNGVAKEWAEVMTYEDVATSDLNAGRYLSGGTFILHRSGVDTYVNYGNRATGRLYLYGSALSFNIGDAGAALILDSNKDASFAANLTVAGNMNSKNFPQGKAFSQDPTSAFITTMFDADAVGDTSYRLKVLRNGTGNEISRMASAYAPLIAIKSSDAHAFISIGHNDYGRSHCYIGAGSADKISWSGILFHDFMSLIPKNDNTFSLGDATHRWSILHAVGIKIGDATLTWDASAGMLKIDKGVYIDGAITAKKKA